jgi:flagellar biosynthesis chaperone FliJ
MGIFGYLSKAHLEHSNVSGEAVAKVQVYDEKILVLKDNIDANRKALKQFDEAVDQIMVRSSDEKGAEKAVNVRRSQQKERARLQTEIQAYQKTISQLNEDRAPLAAEVRKVEAEVGPIKYVAALIYGDSTDVTLLEKSVRWMILLIVFVFDPLAVLMFIAYNQTISRKPVTSEMIQVPATPVATGPVGPTYVMSHDETVYPEDEVEMLLRNPSTGVELKVLST